MRAIVTPLALQVALALLLSGAAVPSRAAGLFLDVCNKGTIPVEVVAAQKNEPLLGFGGLYWDVTGTPVAPGECKGVYGSSAADPVYIAFGFADAKGQWGSGKVTQVPDLGVFVRSFGTHKVLTGAAVPLCAQQGATSYRSAGDLPSSCTGLKYIKDLNGHLIAPDARYGPLLPLTSALYLETAGEDCYDGGQAVACEYHLYISPNPAERELHASVGSARGAEDAQTNSGDSLGTSIWQPPAGAIPKLSAKGTRNAFLQSAPIVAWNFGNDQKWYYENGTPVSDAFKLTGVLESPLFDSQLRGDISPPAGFRDRIIQLEASIKGQLPPGSEFLEEFGDWICNVYNATYYCAHLYALDFDKAELVNDPGFVHLMIPCRSGIVRGGAPYAEALCSIHGREWKAASGTTNKVVFIGRDLNAVVQTDTLFVVASEESGKAVLSALSQLAAELGKYYEPKPVKSVPVQ